MLTSVTQVGLSQSGIKRCSRNLMDNDGLKLLLRFTFCCSDRSFSRQEGR